MRVKNILLENHPVLGNLALNFSKPDGRAYSTIVFIGENGCGKTSVLDEIAAFTTAREDHIKQVEVSFSEKEISTFDKSLKIADFTLNKESANPNQRGIFIIKSGWGQSAYMSGSPNHADAICKVIEKTKILIKNNSSNAHFGMIHEITNQDIDKDYELLNTLKQPININAESNIAQLLVDINNKDAVDFANNYKENGGGVNITPEERLSRFRKSFNNFFNNSLGFSHITSEHEILFEKHNKTFSATKLSSGEAIIVQCGGELLRDEKSTICPLC